MAGGGPPRRRGLLVAAAVAATALVGVAVWAVVQGGGTPDGRSSRSSVSHSVDLPRAGPLPPSTVVAPLAVAGNTDLYLLDTAGATDARPLVTAAGKDLAPLVSPDRATVLYAHEVGGAAGYELRVVASDGTGDRALFGRTVEGCASPRRPAWNVADPQQLAVACYPFQGADSAELRIMTLDGATVRTLQTGVALVDDVSFSPDGTRVVYWGRDDAGDGGQLYSIPADGSGGATQLTREAGNADAVFSPDGKEIAFRRQAQDGTRIYLMAADGTGERALTDAGRVDQDPSWSPDGGAIVFKSNRDGALPGDQFWIIDRNGQGLRQLGHAVEGVADNAAAWGHR